MRFFFAFSFVFITRAQAWACSCPPWEGHISEFTKNYVSVWAVPTNAAINKEDLEKPIGGVTYTLDILEGYDRVTQPNINVRSSVVDGGSCGIELTLGIPQFISAYDYGDEFYAVSSCTPLIPYDAVIDYLENGEDSFIPAWSDCHSWREDKFGHTATFNKELKDCAVWKGADHVDGFMGTKDRWKYSKNWWDKIETTKVGKSRPWWKFWKQSE